MSIKDYLVKADAIKVGVDTDDWKEVIGIAAAPLVANGSILDTYETAIIESTHEYGAYYVLGEGVAIPHARPEFGVQDTCFSMVILKNPISFLDSEEVDIIVMFGAKDSNAHIQDGIRKIVEMLDNDEMMANLRNAKTEQEVINLL